jgi:hypothetical protein
MRDFIRFALVTFFVGISAVAAKADDTPLANIPAPNPPFIAKAPEQSSWLIVITPAGNGTGTAANGKPKSIRAQLWTKSGTAMQCSNEWTDGTRTEDTVIGATKIAQSPDGKGVHKYDPKLDPRYHDFSTGDFEMLDWITPQNYVGAVRHAGERCYLFQTKGAGAAIREVETGPHNQTLEEINTPAQPTSVYVSMNTGLPVEIDNPKDKYVFKFGAPGELTTPEIEPPAPPPPPAPATPPPTKPKVKKTPPAPKPAKKTDTDKTSEL